MKYEEFKEIILKIDVKKIELDEVIGKSMMRYDKGTTINLELEWMVKHLKNLAEYFEARVRFENNKYSKDRLNERKEFLEDEIEKINSEEALFKLIELIKQSNIIFIHGEYGRGKNLLFTKLSQHSELKGNIYHGDFKLSDLPNTGNIYLDYDYLPNSKQWFEFLSVAKHNQQKIFLTATEDLWIKFKELADLIITTRGLSIDEKNYLSLNIQKGDQTWKEKIFISPHDLERLELYLNEKKDNLTK